MSGGRPGFRTGRGYSPAEIIPRIDESRRRLASGEIGQWTREDLDGHPIKFTSDRLGTYLKGISCVICGLEGLHFFKEKHHESDKTWHLNFYGVLPDGTEVMMTSDHIVPKSRGGSNDIGNRQPMCAPCNERKGSSIPLPLPLSA